MRFMIIVKATKDSEAGVMPPESLLMEMAKYHEELQKAGVLLDGTGLQPSSKGFKVKYTGKKRTILDGPFTEAKELIAGYSVIQTLRPTRLSVRRDDTALPVRFRPQLHKF
jgi:hypothetical protein